MRELQLRRPGHQQLRTRPLLILLRFVRTSLLAVSFSNSFKDVVSVVFKCTSYAFAKDHESKTCCWNHERSYRLSTCNYVRNYLKSTPNFLQLAVVIDSFVTCHTLFDTIAGYYLLRPNSRFVKSGWLVSCLSRTRLNVCKSRRFCDVGPVSTPPIR